MQKWALPSFHITATLYHDHCTCRHQTVVFTAYAAGGAFDLFARHSTMHNIIPHNNIIIIDKALKNNNYYVGGKLSGVSAVG